MVTGGLHRASKETGRGLRSASKILARNVTLPPHRIVSEIQHAVETLKTDKLNASRNHRQPIRRVTAPVSHQKRSDRSATKAIENQTELQEN